MYVYTTVNTQIFVCIQIYYHSCKLYLNTHIIVCKNIFLQISVCKHVILNFNHL